MPVAHTYNPSFWEAEIGRIKVLGQPRQIGFISHHLQNNQSKRTGGRAPVLQTLSPEFKLQSHQKTKQVNKK
jgi:hypothetical protein